MTTDLDAAFFAATGSDDPAVQDWLLYHAKDIEAIPGGPGADRPGEQLRRSLALLQGVLRGGLADALVGSEMLALHRSAMACLRRADDPTLSGRSTAEELRLAHQLMTLATRQADLLARRRRETGAGAGAKSAAGAGPAEPGHGNSGGDTQPVAGDDDGRSGKGSGLGRCPPRSDDGGRDDGGRGAPARRAAGGEGPPHPPRRAGDGSPPSPPQDGGEGEARRMPPAAGTDRRPALP